MSVHVAFDIYPAATPNGTRLVRLLTSGTGTKQAVELSARKVLHGSGEGMIRIHSAHAAATSANFAKRNYVKVVIVNGATETVWFGFFLESGDFAAISRREQGGRMLTFSGPGPLYYLDRAVLLEEHYAVDQTARGSLDVDGHWTWLDIPYGAILTRALEEGVAQPGAPLAQAEWDFDREDDSASVAWPNIDNEFQIPWGTKVYDLVAAFIKLGLIVTVDPDLIFHAWQTYGTDRTSVTFAAGKVRFEHGVNISNEVTREIRASLERSHIFVTGSDGETVVVSGGSSAVTYYDTLHRDDTNDPGTLTAAGERNLDAREIQADAAFPVRVILDDDELNGKYIPGDHYDVGDIATIHTVPPSGASGQHDYTNFAIEVAAIRLEHDEAGNWFVLNELGAQYLSPSDRAFEERAHRIIQQARAHSHPEMLCRPVILGAAIPMTWNGTLIFGSPPVTELTDGDTSDPSSAQLVPWSGDPGWEGDAGSTVLFGSIRIHHTSFPQLTPDAFEVQVDNVTVATITAPPVGGWATATLGVSGQIIELVPTDPPAAGPLDGWAISEIEVATAASPGDGHADLIGSSVRAKRCDDTEHYYTTADPTVNDDTTLGFRNNTLWINETSGAMFLLLDNAEGAADWLALGGGITEAEVIALIATHAADVDAHHSPRTFPFFAS